MPLPYRHQNVVLARSLRRNATKQENHLWYDFLRTYPIRFQRQKPIERFIADFYCHKANLIVEVDGSQHYTEAGMIADEERTHILNQYRIEVIRFTNKDIEKNFQGVCESIDERVMERVKLLNDIDFDGIL